jgi:hypothetical protein
MLATENWQKSKKILIISLISGVDVMITIFCDFRQFSEKIAFFSKTNVMLQFSHKLCFESKNAIFVGDVLAKKKLKITTSAPGRVRAATNLLDERCLSGSGRPASGRACHSERNVVLAERSSCHRSGQLELILLFII